MKSKKKIKTVLDKYLSKVNYNLSKSKKKIPFKPYNPYSDPIKAKDIK